VFICDGDGVVEGVCIFGSAGLAQDLSEIKCLQRGFLRVLKTESRSIGMVIVQKPLLLSLSQKHKRETHDRYEQLERFHIFVYVRKITEHNVVMNVKISINQDMVVKSG